MRITPIDIRKQEFRKSMRGYDQDEVDTFLSMIADEMEELIGSSQHARGEVSSLNERLAEYRQMEETMRETLITVQKAADEKREIARKEAEMILKEAEMRAGSWIEEAHRSIRDIKKELAKLRGMRDSYVTRLRMLVQAQMDMLKLAEIEEEMPDETLDLFEEKLEELTMRARERVAQAGEELPEESDLVEVRVEEPAVGEEEVEEGSPDEISEEVAVVTDDFRLVDEPEGDAIESPVEEDREENDDDEEDDEEDDDEDDEKDMDDNDEVEIDDDEEWVWGDSENQEEEKEGEL